MDSRPFSDAQLYTNSTNFWFTRWIYSMELGSHDVIIRNFGPSTDEETYTRASKDDSILPKSSWSTGN